MKELLGKPVADKIKEEVKTIIEEKEYAPTLACIIASADPASETYFNAKKNLFEEVGINIRLERIGIADYSVLNEKTKKQADRLVYQEIYGKILRLNADPTVHGIMLQLPIDADVDVLALKTWIDPIKDVDCVSPKSIYSLYSNIHYTDIDCTRPCISKAVTEILDYYKIPIEGKNVLIVGRSTNTAKPILHEMINRDAMVTVVHSKIDQSKYENLYCNEADIIISCVGRAKFLDLPPKKDATLIDIGYNFDENDKPCGDFNIEKIKKSGFNGNYTPVPKGIGPVTTALSMKNLVERYATQQMHSLISTLNDR